MNKIVVIQHNKNTTNNPQRLPQKRKNKKNYKRKKTAFATEDKKCKRFRNICPIFQNLLFCHICIL